MIYGLTGASGSGKTTLGERLSQRLGIPFVPTSITQMAADRGQPSPVADLNLVDRLYLQHELLMGMETFLENVSRPCIIDRTPIDLIAYMLAEVGMHSCNETPSNFSEAINEYINLCIVLTKKHLSAIYCLDYLPHYEVSEKRPPASFAYQAHCQFIIKGALSEVAPAIPSVGVPAFPIEERTELVYRHISQDIARRGLEKSKVQYLN